MSLKQKKKEIRKKYFSTGALIGLSFFGIIGILMIFFSGILNAIKLNMVYECISQNGLLIIFGILFCIIFFYGWILFFLNFILNPKKEILYLKEDENNEMFFVNKRGKKYNFDFENSDILEANNYYYVLKTKDYIYEVVQKTIDNWETEEKNSYWLNFYSHRGNYENVLILPIVYVMLLLGLLSLFIFQGYQKIYGVIWIIIPLYAIIYDIIYKIKELNENTINQIAPSKTLGIIAKIITIVVALILCYILILMFLKSSDFISKLIFSPFLLCGLCSAGFAISRVFNNSKFKKMFFKGYIIIFLIYCFGMLSFTMLMSGSKPRAFST